MLHLILWDMGATPKLGERTTVRHFMQCNAIQAILLEYITGTDFLTSNVNLLTPIDLTSLHDEALRSLKLCNIFKIYMILLGDLIR